MQNKSLIYIIYIYIHVHHFSVSDKRFKQRFKQKCPNEIFYFLALFSCPITVFTYWPITLTIFFLCSIRQLVQLKWFSILYRNILFMTNDFTFLTCWPSYNTKPELKGKTVLLNIHFRHKFTIVKVICLLYETLQNNKFYLTF
jgi:hypothetical protein